MMFLNNRNFIKGIIIKKIRYKDYHEILHILTEQGNIESFFYENVYLEIENPYSNIVYDVLKNSYISNLLEFVNYIAFNAPVSYRLLKRSLDLVEEGTSEKLVCSYFLLYILKNQGFLFKYQKTDYDYVGYSFLKNSFVDRFNIDESIYGLNNNLVKLIYYLSIHNIDFLQNLDISDSDLVKLFSFFNILLKEYVGIVAKSYKKILELEELLGSNKKEDFNE